MAVDFADVQKQLKSWARLQKHKTDHLFVFLCCGPGTFSGTGTILPSLEDTATLQCHIQYREKKSVLNLSIPSCDSARGFRGVSLFGPP